MGKERLQGELMASEKFVRTLRGREDFRMWYRVFWGVLIIKRVLKWMLIVFRYQKWSYRGRSLSRGVCYNIVHTLTPDSRHRSLGKKYSEVFHISAFGTKIFIFPWIFLFFFLIKKKVIILGTRNMFLLQGMLEGEENIRKRQASWCSLSF